MVFIRLQHKGDVMYMSYIHTIFNHEFLIMTVRIFLAALLSGVVGFEREIKKHPAGFRTHLLVGVGSCLMMLLSLYGFEAYIDKNENIRFDPARIPSYVISGIGFLGAGTILVKDATIRGLTTAASIWVVAGIGLIVGVGMYAPAILTTIVVLLSLVFLNKFERLLIKKSKIQIIHFTADHDFQLSTIIQVIESQEVRIKHINVKSSEIKRDKAQILQFTVELELKNIKQKVLLLEQLTKMEKIRKVFL